MILVAGKYARVGTMLAKESVRKRMDSESGISYTEFTYQLLQVRLHVLVWGGGVVWAGAGCPNCQYLARASWVCAM